MLRILHAEAGRLAHKRGLFIYFAALAVAYGLLTFVRSGGFTATSVVNDAVSFFTILPAFVGGPLFAAIYTDDLTSRNLTALVGYGIGKAKIVFSRLILMVLAAAVVFAIAPLVHAGFYALLGFPASAASLGMVYAVSFKFFLMTVVYAALSGIVVYGIQQTTVAIVTYVVLAFGIVGTLLTVALGSFFPAIKTILVSGITDGILIGITAGAPMTGAIIGFVLYLAAAVGFAVLAFKKKEMEF